MKLWASKRKNSTYLLTARDRPALVASAVRGTASRDYYVPPGDPIGVRHLCAAGFKALAGVDLEPLGQVRIDLTAIPVER